MIAATRDNLYNIYTTNTILIENGYSLEYVDDLIPWEREVLINLLIKRLNEKLQAQENASKGI
jgi:hypothetical protein